MNSSERAVIALIMFLLSTYILALCAFYIIDRKRINVLENRLQNVEHLFSVFISESRPSISASFTNRLPASSDAP